MHNRQKGICMEDKREDRIETDTQLQLKQYSSHSKQVMNVML